MFNLPILLLFYTLSLLFSTASFLVGIFASVAVIFGLVHPASLLQRVQVTTIIVSFWILTPFQREFFPQSPKYKALTLVCLTLLRVFTRSQALGFIAALRLFSWFPPATSNSNAVDLIWLGQIWAQSSWFLLECSYASMSVFGRLGFSLMGYLSRWLLLYLWNIGLLHIQALRQDAKTRFELATSALLGRIHVPDLPSFFGLTPGLHHFFDPWISRILELWKLVLSTMRVVRGNSRSNYPRSSPVDDLPTEDGTNYADYGVCDLVDTTCTEDCNATDHITSTSHEDLLSSYASSITLVSPPAKDDDPLDFNFDTAAIPSADDIGLEVAVVNQQDQDEFYDPLSLFDCKESFMLGLHIDQVIGFGSFGTVYRGCKKGGRLYALKVMKQGSRENLAITLEVAALKRAQGNTDWAVQLQYLQFSDEHVLMAMTYCPGGSLLDLLEVHNGAVSPQLSKFYLAQLILAVHSIHVLGIVHHDIKLDNVMLDSHGNVKLIDFGLAITFNHDIVSKDNYPEFVELRKYGGDQFPLLWATRHNPHTLDDAFGTEGYTAPEVWRGELHSYGVDYFGAACIFHWLITGTAPFEYDPNTDDFSKEQVYIYREEFGISDDEHSFLSCALHERPHKRLNVSQMKNHPLFSDIDWQALNRGEVPPPLVSRL